MSDYTEQYIQRMTGLIEYFKWSHTPHYMGKMLTDRCPECGQVPNGDDVAYHRMHDGWVIQGCEGYWLYDPAMVGMEAPNWSDFRDGIDDMDLWKTTGIS